MAEEKKELSIEEIAEMKRQKYLDLVQRAYKLGNPIKNPDVKSKILDVFRMKPILGKPAKQPYESILMEGPIGGVFIKVDNYYIRQHGSMYHIVREDQMENNTISRCVYVAAEGNCQNLLFIKYYVADPDKGYLVHENKNSIFSSYFFNSDGSLKCVSPMKNDLILNKPFTVICKLNLEQEKLDRQINDLQFQISKLEAKKNELEKIKKSIITKDQRSKNGFLVFGDTNEILDLSLKHSREVVTANKYFEGGI